MVTILSYDWKEQPTLEMLNEALKPHGLKVLSFENGDSFDWVIASADSTTEQMVDALIQTERFEPDEDESESEFRASLAGMLKAE